MGVRPAAASAPWTVEAFPAPVSHSSPLPVSVSCVPGGCVAVGELNGVVNAPLADVWNGTAWQLTTPPAPLTGFGGSYSGVSCTAVTSCLSVGIGFKDFVGFTSSPIAARWDGASWTNVAVPSPKGLASSFSSVSCSAATACTAVGGSVNPLVLSLPTQPFAAQWNGSAWTFRPIPVPAGGSYAGLGDVSCTAANQCTAVGSYLPSKSATTTLPLVERWDGTRWTVQPVPVTSVTHSTGLSAVSCVSVTRCTAVGSSSAAPVAPLAETWDGSTWMAQPVPGTPPDSTLSGISRRAATDCIAVGGSNVSSVGAPNALAARLTSAGWNVEPTAAPATHRALADVSCTTNGCQAVGWNLVNPRDVIYAPLAERHS
jgi:hypothetical protein